MFECGVLHLQPETCFRFDCAASLGVLAKLPNRNRRRITAGLLASVCPAVARPVTALRFGTTPVFLNDQITLLARWQDYLERALQRPVRFVQRGSYSEIIDLLLDSRIDVAWVCGYPFVVNEPRLRLVAIPTYRGRPLYQSYLLVPESDPRTFHVRDLKGQVFAFSDPDSNSGYLVPRVELIRAAQNPATFFRRTFFTFAHRKVVEAVQMGLAHGGAVDGYVWETLRVQQPAATAGVRVAWRSAWHGFPPIVGRGSLSAAESTSISTALRGMRSAADGRALLERLNLDGFDPPVGDVFASIRALVAVSGGTRP
jgi:phosphonate transport system substrate-binding protein